MLYELFQKEDVLDRLNVLLKNIEGLGKSHKRYNMEVAKAITKGLIRDIGKKNVIVRLIKFEGDQIRCRQKKVSRK